MPPRKSAIDLWPRIWSLDAPRRFKYARFPGRDKRRNSRAPRGCFRNMKPCRVVIFKQSPLGVCDTIKMFSEFDTSYEAMRDADTVYRERAWVQSSTMFDDPLEILIDRSNPNFISKRNLVNGTTSSTAKPCWCHSLPYTGGPGDARASAEIAKLEETVKSLTVQLQEARFALSRVQRDSVRVAPATAGVGFPSRVVFGGH